MSDAARSITARIDAVTAIPQEFRTATPPAPRSVKVELTRLCDYACAFCANRKFRAELKAQDPTMSLETFIALAHDLRKAGVEELGLFYLGESFMLDWLPHAVWAAKHQVGFPYVFLTTNGSKATPDKVEACMRAGLDSLKFSLNYADDAQFEAIAGVKAKMRHQALTNMKAARAIRDIGKYDCGLFASYIRFDGEQGDRMARLLNDVGRFFDEYYALPLYNQGGHIEDEGKSWDFSPGNRGRYDKMRDPLPCWAVFTEGHVTFDMKLSACCFDHDGKFNMGDLNEVSFMEAWHSQKFQDLRKSHLGLDVTGTVCQACLVG